MDDAVNGLLLGDIPGTLHGGASTIPGKVGTALHIRGNNQYVDYGLHLDKCYHNPDKCSGGITVALWLNVHTYGSDILDTGATHAQAFGYYMYINSDHSIKISVKDTSMYHQYQAPEFPLNEWVHLVFTWPSNAGLIHLYINGCDADATNRKRYAYNLARYKGITRQSRITLGASPDAFMSYANADVDELIFWESVLDPLEAWQLYVDGGVVRDEWKHCTCNIQRVVDNCARFRQISWLISSCQQNVFGILINWNENLKMSHRCHVYWTITKPVCLPSHTDMQQGAAYLEPSKNKVEWSTTELGTM